MYILTNRFNVQMWYPQLHCASVVDMTPFIFIEYRAELVPESGT